MDGLKSLVFPPRKPYTPEHLLTDGSVFGAPPPVPAEYVKYYEIIGFGLGEINEKWQNVPTHRNCACLVPILWVLCGLYVLQQFYFWFGDLLLPDFQTSGSFLTFKGASGLDYGYCQLIEVCSTLSLLPIPSINYTTKQPTSPHT